jgi:hypothetical protein
MGVRKLFSFVDQDGGGEGVGAAGNLSVPKKF